MDPVRYQMAGGKDFIAMLGADLRGYDVPHQLVEQLYRDTGVRTNPLRGISFSANRFATEAFLDEIARKRGIDPVAYRLELLKDTPRAIKVVERVAQMAEWGRKRDGRALGFAYLDYSGSQVAGIAEVSLDRGSGQIKVHNFWCTIDCGVAVQPDNVVAQTESSIVYGLGVTLSELITIKNGAVEQNNFYDYHVPRMKDVPRDAHRGDRDRQPSDRGRTDGDTARGTCDLERGGRTHRRAPASYSVHSGAGQEGIGVRNEQLGRNLMRWTNSADGLRTLMAGAAAGVLAYSALPALAQSPKIGDPPEAKNMRLVGYNDLQARSAYQPTIQKQGNRYIAYIGHHGGTPDVPKPVNKLTGQAEFNGTSIVDVTDPAQPKYLAHIPGLPGNYEEGGAQMVRVCDGKTLPQGRRRQDLHAARLRRPWP